MIKKIIICLIFLVSFANAIRCYYNGYDYVDIPESKLSDIGYTKYNITHSYFDCKMAYKRYLKIKEIEPANVSYITKNEKNELKRPEQPILPLFLLVIVGVIWLIKNVIKNEPQDEWYTVAQKATIKQKETYSVKKEPVKSWDDLSREYSENLKKLEQERVKNGFYEIPKPKLVNNSLDKTKTAYDLLLERPEWKAYRLKVLAERGEKCEWCGSTNKILQVHHKFYLKYPDGKYILPWEYNINCLLVLCKDCHTKAHKQYKIKSYYISY